MRTFTQKLLCSLVLLLCCVSLQVRSEELIVADGAAINTNLPITGSWVDVAGTRSQCLYPSDSLTDLEGATITKMTFYIDPEDASGWADAIFQVSLAESTESGLTKSEFLGNLTSVYSGGLSVSQPTIEVVFSSPYLYSGGNLVVDFQVQTGGTWKTVNFYGVDDIGFVAGHYFFSNSHDLKQFLPKVKFDYIPASGPKCERPSSLDVIDLTTSSASLVWAGGSGEYNVEYKAASATDWTSLLANSSALTTSLSNLAPATTYQARVQAVCEESTSGRTSISFTTPYAIPYEQNFFGNAMPADWLTYKGLLSEVLAGTASLSRASDNIKWKFSSSAAGELSQHAYCEIMEDNTKDWLVLPAVQMGSNVQLSFWMALSNSYGRPVTAGSQPDDKFAVLLSSDNGATWTILRQWDNSGASQYSYDNISPNGEEISIDLSAYSSGLIKLAFYGESTVSGGGARLHIDSVLVDKIPTCFKPTALEASAILKNSVQLSWVANSGETAWKIQYKKSSETAWQTIDVTENPYVLSGLESLTDYDVHVAAVCDGSASDGTSKYSQTIHFKTVAGVPYTEPFSASSMPVDWSTYRGLLSEIMNNEATLNPVATSATWKVASGNGVFAGETHLLLLNSGADSRAWVVSPEIQLDDNVQFSFDLALTGSNNILQPVVPGEQDDDKFVVLISTDNGANWGKLKEWNNTDSENSYDAISCTSEGQEEVCNLSAYAGQKVRIAFYGESTVKGGDSYIHIGNLHVDYIPACEKPLGLILSDVTSASATFEWNEAQSGSEPWIFGVAANPADDFSPEAADFTGSTSDTWAEIDTLRENTDYIFFIRRNCGGEIATRRFHTSQASANLPYADDFESGNKWAFNCGGMTNAWAYGSATNNGGSHALYISNDGGATNAYTLRSDNTVVYATKLFTFGDGTYTFQYDWKAKGEGSSDYLRVVLVPASVNLFAGSTLPSGLTTTVVPAGWKALAGGTKLNLSNNEWKTVNLEVEVAAGEYNVVFVWRNDAISGSQTPAAIDNFSITPTLCARPIADSVATNISTRSILLKWKRQDSDAWLLQYKNSAESNWTAISEPIVTDSIRIEGLTPATSYDFRVAAWCDVTDPATISEYSAPFTVLTACEAISSFPYSENFDSYNVTQTSAPSSRVLPLCWSFINTTTNSKSSAYPTVFKYYNSYAASTPNTLRLYSYYSSTVNYDPQDEYAILPEMFGVNGLQMTFKARAYMTGNTNSAEFTVGVMTDPSDTATFVEVATFEPTTTTFQSYEVKFNGYSGAGKYIAIKMTAADATKSTHSVLIDDIAIDELPCYEASGLAVSDITSAGATFSWNDEVNGAWKYAVALSTDAEPAEDAFIAIDTNAIVIDTLADLSDYVFYLSRVCKDGLSQSISVAFSTTQQVATIPFADDFEDANMWLFVNGTSTNAWAYGQATANGGSHALYISNDGGVSNAYSTTEAAMVYATKLFFFEEGTYAFSYDWKAEGRNNEDVPADYLRVALVPATATFPAGMKLPSFSGTNLPNGWIALDGGHQLNQSAEWQTISIEDVAIEEGTYKILLAWRNESTDGVANTPAAVDNFTITKKSVATGINSAASADKPLKFIRNRQVYILVNGVVYDAMGRKVEVKK